MSDLSQVESILLGALAKAEGQERAAYLAEICNGSPELQAQVEKLLSAHPKAAAFLEKPAGGATAHHVPSNEYVGNIIAGRYKLLEKIGEGGMGEVWVAEQTAPVRRKVALKLIKAGMDSKSVLARFEAERQALAVMDHPNIAKVLDGGLTEQGRPYFVMEYVKGVPITEYCDATRLSVQERLGLFTQVCQAVQHAHQKGIIHRDLKPSNILVAPYDDKPVPKVIDFGLAKAMHQSLTERTLHTAHDIVLGTPLYMSPEQAQLNNLDVDTRSDVYSLGVLLYELLTGTTPLEMKRFKEAAWDEVKRMIREEDPPRPSTRLSSTSTLPSLAAGRQLEPARLTKLVRGELDWIVMKSLEKDRNRRYESANAFAVDVQRFLAGETVQAAPPSATYRLRKFARKHRALLTTAGAFVGLLVVAVAVSGWLAIRARWAEAKAKDKTVEAEANAKNAERNFGFALNSTMEALWALKRSEIQSLSIQIDLEIADAEFDSRVGLLRLSRPRKFQTEQISSPFMGDSKSAGSLNYSNDSEFQYLCQFATAAVLAKCQEFAPLLPPITHDGYAIDSHHVVSDQKRLLTHGDNGTARLWSLENGQLIALLSSSMEKVVNVGISSDSKMLFTEDDLGVVRFWDLNGKLCAQTVPRPNCYWTRENQADFQFFPIERSECTILGRNRLLTKIVRKGEGDTQELVGPVELWDATTGQRLIRLDSPGQDLRSFQFCGDGRWIAAVTDTSKLTIFSGETGERLADLAHPSGQDVIWSQIATSADGQRLSTVAYDRSNPASLIPILRLWDTQSWKQVPGEVRGFYFDWFRLRNGDILENTVSDILKEARDVGIYLFPLQTPLALSPWWSLPDSKGEIIFDAYGRVFDCLTWQQRVPDKGQRFHRELARFASNQRFVVAMAGFSHLNGQFHYEHNARVIDINTEKSFPLKIRFREFQGFHAVDGLGFVGVKIDREAKRIVIPTFELDKIDAQQLELWTKVALCGELNDQGEFVKWTESEWEKKRQELAAIPPPIKDFPFPGYVATDKLHWLRAEYSQAKDEAVKKQLAQELLRRAEKFGDKAEAARWSAVLALPLSKPQ